MTHIFNGEISLNEFEENYETLFIGKNEEPFSKIWSDLFYKKQVSVRYYISDIDTEKSIEELKENHLLSISGSVYADYSERYSDLTGYLWTDESLKVGGHDLLQELQDNVGKYLYMEVNHE